MTACCPWCGRAFRPRISGGSDQRFSVRAFDDQEEIGNGTHERALVNLAKMTERLKAKHR